MGKTTNEIEAAIERSRLGLGEDLEELQMRVEDTIDWRVHFDKNPGTFLAVAFGGGMFLAALVARRNSINSSGSMMHSLASVGTDGYKRSLEASVDLLKDALVGVAASHVKSFIGQLVPGFHDEWNRAEIAAGRSSR